jgi:hypothetical protein
MIHNDFSVSHRAKTMLVDANSVPKTHLILGMIFLTVVPLPTHSRQARSCHSSEFFLPAIRALM